MPQFTVAGELGLGRRRPMSNDSLPLCRADVIAFETERLHARGFSLDDAEDAFQVYSDPDVVRHLLGAKPTESLAAQHAWLERVIAKYASVAPGFGAWAVIEKASGRMVGTVMLKPGPMVGAADDEGEIGWHLAKRVWGRGYATEIGRAVIDHGHERLTLERLIALVAPANERSSAVARRIGMRDLGLSRQYDEGNELRVWESVRDQAAATCANERGQTG